MLLGYNTNGLAHHEPIAAIELLASIGYRSVAISIDHDLLNPFAREWRRQLDDVRHALDAHRLRSVIETGARFLLDPLVKHEPTLISADSPSRQRRIAFLKHAIDVAHALESDCVSLWSGAIRDGADEDVVWERLVDSLREVLDYGATKNPPVAIGFEPEPGMFIDTMERFAELQSRLPHERLRLTLDLGHLHCLGEGPIADVVRSWCEKLVNVHIEDMRAGTHEHLMFGEGEMDFPPILKALAGCGYAGGVHVELSRHSHVGPQAARQAFEFLSRAMAAARSNG